MKKIIVFIVLLLPALLFAQPKQGKAKVDSMMAMLPSSHDDTNKVKLLVEIATACMYTGPDEGIRAGQQALELAQKLKWEKGEAMAYNYIGQNYYVKADYDKALSYDLKALELNQKIGFKPGVAKNLGNIGNVYTIRNENALAMQYFQKGLKMDEEIGDKKHQGIALGNIGILFSNQSNYARALEYYFKALKINEENDDKVNIATNLINIGIIYKNQGNYQKSLEHYFKALKLTEEVSNTSSSAATLSNIGTVYKLEDSLDRALDYYERALAKAKEAGHKKFVTINIGNIGEVKVKQHQFVEALHYFDEAIRLNTEYGFKSSLAYNYSAKGECYLVMARTVGQAMQNSKQAIGYLEKAIAIFRETGEVKQLGATTGLLSEAETLLGNYKGALESYKLAELFKDSVAAMSTTVQIRNLDARREIEVKERDIEIQNNQIELEKLRKANRDKERIIYLSGIVVLLVVLGFGLDKFVKQQRSNRLLSQEKTEHLQHIKAQGDVLKDIAYIQSHEVRGPVTTIKGLAGLFNMDDLSDPVNKELMEGIITVTDRLDDVVTAVVNKENQFNKGG